MVTKRTGGPRTGRPKKDGVVPFLQNPKRNYVMLMRATMACMPQPPSIRRAAKIIAVHAFGNGVGHEGLPPDVREIVENWRAKMIKAHGPGVILASVPDGPVVHKADGGVSYKNTMRGAKASTIEGAAEYIRKLDRQAMKEAETNPAVARWLRCAVSGCIGAMKGAPASIVAGSFRISGDPELEANWPGLVSFLKKSEQT